ncbi:hypothetical protein AWENTII_002487 [Aspergillus wentii]
MRKQGILPTFSRSCLTLSTSSPFGALSSKMVPALRTVHVLACHTLHAQHERGNTKWERRQHDHHSYTHASSWVSVPPSLKVSQPHDQCCGHDPDIVGCITKNMEKNTHRSQVVTIGGRLGCLV